MTATRVIITGGAGFIGSHLCDRFLADGWRVTAVDNLVTGSLDNLRHLESEARFDFVEADLIEGLPVSGEVDAILHFASPASPLDYQQLPIATMRVGSEGTRHALEVARAHRATLLMASTSEVYGDPQVHPQREGYWGHVNPIGPRSVYDEAKRFSEAMVTAYRRSLQVDTRIIRIFNTYGPRMRIGDGRVVPAFMERVILGRPLTIFGDGSQSRSFCYVDDLVDGIARMLASGQPGPVNLGNPVETTIRELAELVLELFGGGASARYTAHPLPEDDPKVRCPDISQARELLGWTPVVPLRDGLGRCEAYFREAVSSQAHR